MPRRKPLSIPWIILLLATVMVIEAGAQNRTLPEEDWYAAEKKMLSDHYTGKSVRLKLMIPATRTGLELLDGVPQTRPVAKPPEAAGMPGDELLIRSLRIGLEEIEVVLGKKEPEPRKRTLNPFNQPRPPRISMRFSREITSKDLTVGNIDRLLGVVVELPEEAPAERAAEAPGPGNQQAEKRDDRTLEPDEVREMPSLPATIGELTITCAGAPARVYIDGAFSGRTPLTVRLRSGIHTIAIIGSGSEAMERKVSVPGGKASLLKAQLERR